jgi:hypothetical protein
MSSVSALNATNGGEGAGAAGAAPSIIAVISEQLRQRIYPIECEAERLSSELVIAEGSYRAIRADVVHFTAEEYAAEVEIHEAFAGAQGPLLETMFFQHRFSKVREWAACARNLATLRTRLRELQQQKECIEKEALCIVATPVEIRSLEDEQAVLRAEAKATRLELQREQLGTQEQVLQLEQHLRSELHHLQHENEQLRGHIAVLQAEAIEMKAVMQVFADRLQALEQAEVQRINEQRAASTREECVSSEPLPTPLHQPNGHLAYRRVSVRRSHNSRIVVQGSRLTQNVSGYQKAIGGKPFPFDRATYFVFSVEILPQDWLFCGIISNTRASSPSRADRTCYGWGGRQSMRQAGVLKVKHQVDGWDTWKQGDVSVFEYDPNAGSLTMYHCRLNRRFAVHNLPIVTFSLHLNLFYAGTVVHVSPPTLEQMKCAGFREMNI